MGEGPSGPLPREWDSVGDRDTEAQFRLRFCKDRSSTGRGGGPRVGRLRNYSEDIWVRSGVDVTSDLRPRAKRARMVSATYLYVQETLNRRYGCGLGGDVPFAERLEPPLDLDVQQHRVGSGVD